MEKPRERAQTIDYRTLWDLQNAGWDEKHISEKMGVSPEGVHRVLQKFEDHPEILKNLKIGEWEVKPEPEKEGGKNKMDEYSEKLHLEGLKRLYSGEKYQITVEYDPVAKKFALVGGNGEKALDAVDLIVAGITLLETLFGQAEASTLFREFAEGYKEIVEKRTLAS